MTEQGQRHRSAFQGQRQHPRPSLGTRPSRKQGYPMTLLLLLAALSCGFSLGAYLRPTVEKLFKTPRLKIGKQSKDCLLPPPPSPFRVSVPPVRVPREYENSCYQSITPYT
jgi:hypothetical protein